MATKDTNGTNGTNGYLSNGGPQKLPNNIQKKRPRKEGEPMVLPPGISVEQFKDFITKVQAIVGKENVEVILPDNPLKDQSYHNPCHGHGMHAVFDKDYFVSSAIVCPRGVPEVQDIMRLCNQFEMPIWPYSIGRNTGYGGSAPKVPGSIGLNLGKNMNKVLKVDTEDAWALVEPGVTYSDLQNYMEERGMREKVWLDMSSDLAE